MLQIRPAELIRALQRIGWYIDREGKHTIMRHPERSGSVPIPRHGQRLKTGTLASIIKSVGLTERQLKEIL